VEEEEKRDSVPETAVRCWNIAKMVSLSYLDSGDLSPLLFTVRLDFPQLERKVWLTREALSVGVSFTKACLSSY
jgi:hypothetical protein